VPARFDTSVLTDRFAEYGGAGAKIWTFLTYSFLHADLTHLVFNMIWLLPFGSAVGRRFGAMRFFLFLSVSAIAGAGAHLATHARELAPMIGASAAVSGAMAAAIRFAFGRGGFLSFRRGDADAAATVPALPLLKALRHPRVIAFLAMWFGINIIFGLGSAPFVAASQSVAWQAHIGGFLAGLLLFSMFDPIPPASRNVASASLSTTDGG
jgi:membrane associated rhomboid family serine protease